MNLKQVLAYVLNNNVQVTSHYYDGGYIVEVDGFIPIEYEYCISSKDSKDIHFIRSALQILTRSKEPCPVETEADEYILNISSEFDPKEYLLVKSLLTKEKTV